MIEYEVTVVQEIRQSTFVSVEARNEEEAKEKALDAVHKGDMGNWDEDALINERVLHVRRY